MFQIKLNPFQTHYVYNVTWILETIGLQSGNWSRTAIDSISQNCISDFRKLQISIFHVNSRSCKINARLNWKYSEKNWTVNKEPIRLIKGTMGLRSLCHFEIVAPAAGKDLNLKEFDLWRRKVNKSRIYNILMLSLLPRVEQVCRNAWPEYWCSRNKS